MSITRKCGACGMMVLSVTVLELQVRVLKTDGLETQDALEQSYDDYCDTKRTTE